MKTVNAKFSKGFDLSRRGGGVLLHVSSLPGPFGIGDLGPTAHAWIDMLAEASQRWWQILPLGYTGSTGSPYRCFSAFACNPILISPEALVTDGLLQKSELTDHEMPPGSIDFNKVTRSKMSLLRLAYDRLQSDRRHPYQNPIAVFSISESAWLDDFALFMALAEADPTLHWTQWPKPILRRNSKAIALANIQHAQAIDRHRFIQYVFARQLEALRMHAHRRNIGLIGDLPIFISPDSADVWTHPELFQLDARRQPTAVAGVPPDLFSATGQRWGNPLYNWKQMAKDNFAWWKARMQSALQQTDLVRIDHFRGLEAYWRIPASCPTAQEGKWVKAPGYELFEALLQHHAHLPLLAEDLGIITPEVEQLRDHFHLPGMRVVQFGFSGTPGDVHTPHNFIRHCFAYTGTHDNDTTVGWFNELPRKQKQKVIDYAPQLRWSKDPAGSLLQLLWASSAGQAIVPMQDLLKLDGKSRMNTPGNALHNWRWRMISLESCKGPLSALEKLSQTYERLNDS